MGHRIHDGSSIDLSHYVFAPLKGGQKEYDEREQWCIDNLKGGFYHNVTGGHFYEESDALLFLMEWAWKHGQSGIFQGQWP